MPTPREDLADLLLAAGPDAPTVCEGWDARDLAVHLLVREARPDAAVGLHVPRRGRLLGALADHGARVESALAARPFTELVEEFRAGPPRWTPMAVAAVERAANDVEFFVHGEDVRRGSGTWTPAPPDPQRRQQLWTALRRQAWFALRASPVGVVLVVPDGPRAVAVRPRGQGGESLVLVGQPEELLLHVSGRERIAAVEVRGSSAAVAAATAPRSR